MMQLDLKETVAKQIFLTGAFEPDLLWLMAGVVDAGQSVIDSGAHIGFFSLALGLLVGPEGRVDAFEPVPSIKQHLDTNIRNAELNNVFAHDLALWHENTVLSIGDYGHQFSAYNGVRAARIYSNGAMKRQEVSVPATSIDSFVETTCTAPSFIKLDVESAEYEVIKGMNSVIASNRPTIAFEIGDFEESNLYSSYQVMQLLAEASYELFHLKNCRLSQLCLQNTHYDYANVVAFPRRRFPHC